MTYQEAVEFITAANAKGSCPGLERIEELMSRLGDPQAAMRFVHVTGTNGKGSAATMLSSVLTAAGYRVGLYTSPHLLSYKEDFRVNGRELSTGSMAAKSALCSRAPTLSQRSSSTRSTLSGFR